MINPLCPGSQGLLTAPGSSCEFEPNPEPEPWLNATLKTIGEFGIASAELVAWDLSLDPEPIRAAVLQALAEGLIEEAGVDIETGEQLYRLVGGAQRGSGESRRRA